mmetsp:Transcript_3696/g.10816  ORF Transcript_3696/g.10816 Transcript_3696/m.10816 type:complete len:296 (+) Transcript_3696:2265-3152(+)
MAAVSTARSSAAHPRTTGAIHLLHPTDESTRPRASIRRTTIDPSRSSSRLRRGRYGSACGRTLTALKACWTFLLPHRASSPSSHCGDLMALGSWRSPVVTEMPDPGTPRTSPLKEVAPAQPRTLQTRPGVPPHRRQLGDSRGWSSSRSKGARTGQTRAHGTHPRRRSMGPSHRSKRVALEDLKKRKMCLHANLTRLRSWAKAPVHPHGTLVGAGAAVVVGKEECTPPWACRRRSLLVGGGTVATIGARARAQVNERCTSPLTSLRRSGRCREARTGLRLSHGKRKASPRASRSRR